MLSANKSNNETAAAPVTGKVRVCSIQYQLGKIGSFDHFAERLQFFASVASTYGADFLLFPELFTLQILSSLPPLSVKDGITKITEYTEKFVALLSELSQKNKVVIIGGSHPSLINGAIQNICYISLPTGETYLQPKVHITPNEKKTWGIVGGDSLGVIETAKAKIGALICYDVQFPEASRFLADQGADIIFVPFCTDTRLGQMRVRYCAQASAVSNQLYVVTAGVFGNMEGVPNMELSYAQSGIFSPSDYPFARDGIVAEAELNREMPLICDLDLSILHRARASGSVTHRQDRRAELFRYECAAKPLSVLGK